MKAALGRAEETEAHVATAMRLSPRDPRLGSWYIISGLAHLYLGGLDAAVDHLRKSVELSPTQGDAWFYLAAALALAGRNAEAANAIARGRSLLPTISIARFRSDAKSDHPVVVAQHERLYEGMRKAGVPEE
jgi:Flp pilus assembly protein TadD